MTPIGSRDSRIIEGHLILCLFSRGDEDMKKLWPDLKHAHGDDVLKDAANTMFQTALSKGVLALPIPHKDRAREEMLGWIEEKVWALSVHEQKYDDVRCAQFGLWRGARRAHPRSGL